MFIYQAYSSLYYRLRYNFFKLIPLFCHKYILKLKYKSIYKEKLNLKNPLKLSEKIQWIKIYGDKRKKTYLSDKILVKNYIKDNIPELKCAKIYQISKKFEDLDWGKLPNQFILKTNHAWKTNVVIDNKENITKQEYKKISAFYKNVLKINYAYWSYFEMQYNNIIPCIYAEEYIGKYKKINEYEVWCFNGNVEFIMYKQSVKIDKYNAFKINYYNSEWQEQNFYIKCKSNEKIILRNNKYKVIDYAKILSKDIDFVRIDFMEVNDELYFCEMTFTPYSGYIDIQPRQYDLILGEKLKLDCNK